MITDKRKYIEKRIPFQRIMHLADILLADTMIVNNARKFKHTIKGLKKWNSRNVMTKIR